MKKVMVLFILLFNFSVLSAQIAKESYLRIVQNFIYTIESGDRQAISDIVRYPLRRGTSRPAIVDKSEFVARFDEIFDENILKIISVSNPQTDWTEMGWRGIMLLNGKIWLDHDGKLISVNYTIEPVVGDDKEHAVSVNSVYSPKTDTLLVAAMDDKTLVVTETEEARQMCYYLLDKGRVIIDSMEFMTHRQFVLNRAIRDRNGDGLQDLVETRKYQGQMFSSITDVVYSVAGNKFKRIFSIDTHELDCSTTDENNCGIITRREYEQITPDVFSVSEVKGYVNCEDDPDIPNNAKPVRIIDRRRYDVTSEELLKMYGEQYDER